MKRTPHTSFPKGRRLFVILTSGEKFVDRYVEKTNRSVVFEREGAKSISEIRSIGYFKGAR